VLFCSLEVGDTIKKKIRVVALLKASNEPSEKRIFFQKEPFWAFSVDFSYFWAFFGVLDVRGGFLM